MATQMRDTTFAVTRNSGGSTASFTVDPRGRVIASTGFDTDDVPVTLNGFSADSSGALDISARYALAGNVRVTLGLTPIVTTEHGTRALLYYVSGAARQPLAASL